MRIPSSGCLVVYVCVCVRVFSPFTIPLYQQDDFFVCVCAVFKTTILHLKYFHLMVIIISFYKSKFTGILSVAL